MNICNQCGAEIPIRRYGPTETLCANCLGDLRWQDTHQVRDELLAALAYEQRKEEARRIAWRESAQFVGGVLAAALVLGVAILAMFAL